MKFDYDELAKKFFEQLNGNTKIITLEDFTNEYISFVDRNRAAKTCEGVKLVAKHLLAFYPPVKEINTIELKDAENFIDHLRKTAPLGVYNYLRTLKSMFNKGIEWNYIRSNVFEKVRLPKRQIQKPNYVNEIQLKEIIKHIETEIVKDVVMTAFYSGCRLGEIVNLTWQDVNLKDELLNIGNKTFETKTRKQRSVPIHPKIMEILIKRFPKIIKKEKHYVFCKNVGSPFTGDYFSKRFKCACREAGLNEDIHFHCLRHGAATRMIINGAPLPSVQRILGHSNIQTTMIYTHPDLKSLRDAVNML